MNRWTRIEELFCEALSLADADRHEFLVDECGRDLEMLQELQRLLEGDSRADAGFLSPPLPPPSPRLLEKEEERTDPLLKITIGNFRIKKLIASGGMGRVYWAEQLRPTRNVALKVMNSSIWSRSIKRRFEFESEVLAKLQHPNIAAVHDAGTHQLDSGGSVCYFAMEFISDAKTIIQFAAAKSLKQRERLAIFLQLCDAIHHGHQKGVIHRDIKPANVLIDEEGQLKVIDFGIARAMTSDIAATTMHTEVGQVLGTLAYMSPEQCGPDPSEIDTRSDVYSLGVLLFELLTDQLPYDVSRMTLHGAAGVIGGQEPPVPSSINKKLKGDPDTIILKCLAKNRAERYTSVAALADDIRCYQRGEPIAAHPPTLWTRLIRSVARHPVLFTLLLCVLFVLSTIVASTAIVWFTAFRPDTIVKYGVDGPLPPGNPEPFAKEVRLLSRNSSVLHRWGGAPESIGFAQLVRQAPMLGGRRLALVGYSGLEDGTFARYFCAYDVDRDLDKPLWFRSVETDDVLATLRKDRSFDGRRFSAGRGIIADIFHSDGCPGDEVVVVFKADTSQRILRVHDLAGKLLWQSWYDGAAHGLYWMAGARLLVFAGDDQHQNWDSLGKTTSSDGAPLVVFALRPRLNHIGRDDYLNSTESLSRDMLGDESTEVAWFLWLYEEDDRLADPDQFLLTVERPRLRDARWFANVVVRAKSNEGNISWAIDESGNEVPGTRVINDSYTRARLEPNSPLPDPRGLHLVPRRPNMAAGRINKGN